MRKSQLYKYCESAVPFQKAWFRTPPLPAHGEGCQAGPLSSPYGLGQEVRKSRPRSEGTGRRKGNYFTKLLKETRQISLIRVKVEKGEIYSNSKIARFSYVIKQNVGCGTVDKSGIF